ncbi:putative reverse transcriptase domain-containing protein [Tanacetum coccineum]
MTIQSSVKDKILATLSETPKEENAPAEMLRDIDQQMEKRADDGEEAFQTLKNNLCDAPILSLPDGVEDFVVYCDASNQGLVGDALSRNERVKSRRVRGMILATQSKAFKQENVLLVGSVMDEAHASSLGYLSENEIESPWILSLNSQGQSSEYDVIWVMVDRLTKLAHFLAIQEDFKILRWMIYLVVLADTAESVRDAIEFEYCLASSSGWTKSPVLWAEIRGSSLIGPELVLETTDKVVLINKKLKSARNHQKSYADKRRKPLEFEVGPFEILERIGLVAYRLRLPEELNSVHDTFHVSNLKKCLADASLHVPLDEIKVDKTLCFVEEPVEIMDREIKSLKCSKISLVKVHWNPKRGPEFTWEREDYMKSRYP